MMMRKQEAVYPMLAGFSAGAVITVSNGLLQRWIGVEAAQCIFILALAAALIVSQHLLLLALVALYKKRIQPIFWLFGCSRPAIRAVLHASALASFAIGIPSGFMLGSNLLLAAILGLALTISFATEWTFMGNWGALAALLRRRDDDYAIRAARNFAP